MIEFPTTLQTLIEKISRPEAHNEAMGCDLQLIPSVKDVSDIPRAGTRLIILVVVGQVLHCRIFNGDGKMVMDTDEKRLTKQAVPSKDLRERLEGLWPPHELTESEMNRIIAAVTNIVGRIQTMEARTRLAAAYWRPVYCFFRAKRLSEDQATERTQEFFLRKVCEKPAAFGGYDHKRRFRVYLRGVLEHFHRDQERAGHTRRGQIDRDMVTFIDLVGKQDKGFDPRWDGADPVQVFDEQYDENLVERAIQNFKESFKSQDEYDAFLDYYLPQGDCSSRGPSQAGVAEKHNLTRDKVRSVLKRGKEGLGNSLRDVLRAEGVEEVDLAKEMQRLYRLLEARILSDFFRLERSTEVVTSRQSPKAM